MAAADYTQNANAPMCPIGIVGGDVGYSASSILLKNIINVDTGDIVVGMAAMLNDEIMEVTGVTLPFVQVTRGCADTVPAVHRDGDVIWFFSQNMGSDKKAYVAGDTHAVKILPYSTSGDTVPIEASPPNDITFNWRHVRPYPPGNVKCKGTAWYNSLKEMALGEDELAWSWAHRDRVLQADQLVGHLAASIGPEPGTTYTIRVYNFDNVLVRTVTGITGTSWVYTRAMAEADDHTAPQASVTLHSVRDGLESLQGYRTAIQLTGANAVTLDIGALGWPGTKTNCGVDGLLLVNAGTKTWDGDYDLNWDDTEDEWKNVAISPMVYEHPPLDLGGLGEYRITLPVTASGVVTAEIQTSTDGVTYTGWAAPAPGYVTMAYLKARFTVTGADPLLSSAKISYFRRS